MPFEDGLRTVLDRDLRGDGLQPCCGHRCTRSGPDALRGWPPNGPGPRPAGGRAPTLLRAPLYAVGTRCPSRMASERSWTATCGGTGSNPAAGTVVRGRDPMPFEDGLRTVLDRDLRG